MKKNIRYIFILLITILFHNCIDPFEAGSITFDDLLVVEARITNENKKHQIKLSRTFRIDSLANVPEKESIITVTDNLQNVYDFTEIEDGIYESDISFAADVNNTYVLNIKTKSSGEFSSSSEGITGFSQIEDIRYNVEKNNFEEEIVRISVDSKSTENNARYYLFEYEETYRLVAPYWSPFELDLSIYPPEQVVLKSDQGGQVCYKTDASNEIIQSETESLSEGDLKDFTVRSISTQNHIIAHRYSILIKQYVQSLEAYSFYETLKKFSESEGVFSENQVGFIQGNITSNNDDNRQVIGFFEVASVSKKRIFFNVEDLNINVVNNYSEECNLIAPKEFNGFSPNVRPLLNALQNGYQFYDLNGLGLESKPGPYLLANDTCADCRLVGEPEKPDFWID